MGEADADFLLMTKVIEGDGIASIFINGTLRASPSLVQQVLGAR